MSGNGAKIDSPCTGVCRISGTTGLCEGCFRSLDEIARWGVMGPAARRAVMEELPGRKRAATADGMGALPPRPAGFPRDI